MAVAQRDEEHHFILEMKKLSAKGEAGFLPASRKDGEQLPGAMNPGEVELG